jgi:hypothetical protein
MGDVPDHPSHRQQIHVVDLTDAKPEDDDRWVAVLGGLRAETPAWLPENRAEFLRRVDAIAGPRELWIWPTCGGAISDVPSLLTFLRTRPQWKFILDPVSMLTPSLLPRLDDHMRRLFDALGSHDQLGATLICSCDVRDNQLIHSPSPALQQFDDELARYAHMWALMPVIHLGSGPPQG